MVDLHQSSKYGQFMEKIGWDIVRLQTIDYRLQLFIKKIPLLPFSLIKIQRPVKIPSSILEEIDRIAKKHHALFIKLEPQQCSNKTMKQPVRIATQSVAGGLNNHGYKLDKSPLLPTKTLRIDLTPSEDQIFSQFTKDCRYEIRQAEKNNLQVVISSEVPMSHRDESRDLGRRPHASFTLSAHANVLDFSTRPSGSVEMTKKLTSVIDEFISLWHQSAWSRGFWIPIKKQIKSLWEAFGNDAYLISATRGANKFLRNEGQFVPEKISLATSALPDSEDVVAGALIVFFDKVAYYFYAASSPQGRNLSAPSLVVWEAIKLAKSKGCTLFDFEGIYDERFPNKSWLGFTHFKKSFGGQELIYPGCFTKIYNPIFRLLPF